MGFLVLLADFTVKMFFFGVVGGSEEINMEMQTVGGKSTCQDEMETRCFCSLDDNLFYAKPGYFLADTFFLGLRFLDGV